MSYEAEISQGASDLLSLRHRSIRIHGRNHRGGPLEGRLRGRRAEQDALYAVTTCSKSDGVRNYFDVGVIAYGGSEVTSGFKGRFPKASCTRSTPSASTRFASRSARKRWSDGAGGIVELKTKFPIWFDLEERRRHADARGLQQDQADGGRMVRAHPGSYPPTILHVTDGQSTDGAPEEAAEGLRRISTKDGQALLFNLHVTSRRRAGNGVSEIRNRPPRRVLANTVPDVEPAAGTSCQVCWRQGLRGRGRIARLHLQWRSTVHRRFFEIGTRPKLVADR